MRAETKADRVFGNPHEVGKFIEKQVGRVNSVRITRSGVVIIVCGDVKQLNKAQYHQVWRSSSTHISNWKKEQGQ